MTREEVYTAIDSERDYQLKMWSDYQNDDNTTDNPLTIGENLVLIQSYLNKPMEAWVLEKKPCINTLDNIRKIAGICVRTGEQHGMPKR